MRAKRGTIRAMKPKRGRPTARESLVRSTVAKLEAEIGRIVQERIASAVKAMGRA